MWQHSLQFTPPLLLFLPLSFKSCKSITNTFACQHYYRFTRDTREKQSQQKKKKKSKRNKRIYTHGPNHSTAGLTSVAVAKINIKFNIKVNRECFFFFLLAIDFGSLVL